MSRSNRGGRAGPPDETRWRGDSFDKPGRGSAPVSALGALPAGVVDGILPAEEDPQIDEKYLGMNAEDYNCMAVVTSQTYNSDGVMFEYTQSRHRPDHFRFYENAVRKPG